MSEKLLKAWATVESKNTTLVKIHVYMRKEDARIKELEWLKKNELLDPKDVEFVVMREALAFDGTEFLIELTTIHVPLKSE